MIKFILIFLFISTQVYAQFFIDTVKECTFRISETYIKPGATCFLIQDKDNVIIVTNKHVIEDNINKTVDIWKDDILPDNNKDKINLTIFKENLLNVEPSCGDISVFYSKHSYMDWKSVYKINNMIQEINLISIEETDMLNQDMLFVYGYPIDFNGFLIESKKFLKFNYIEKTKLIKKRSGDGCGFLYHGNYKILNTPGGLSGSPIFSKNSIIGINSGSLVNENKSDIVPAEYIKDAISILKTTKGKQYVK